MMPANNPTDSDSSRQIDTLTATQRNILEALCAGRAIMITVPPWRLWFRVGRPWRNLKQTTVDALMPFLSRDPLGNYQPNEVAAAWYKQQIGGAK